MANADQVHFDTPHATVRYLFSGNWVQVMQLPPPAFPAVLAHLRTLASIAAAEAGRSQEGVAPFTVNGITHQVRVTTQFTDAGVEVAYAHLGVS
jgi:type II secretory ATPase GspE/PulE/Tfp pilus assembly ATPase PilB-like protein